MERDALKTMDSLRKGLVRRRPRRHSPGVPPELRERVASFVRKERSSGTTTSQPSVYLGGGENRDKLAQRQGAHRIGGEIGSAVGLSDALERPVSYALDEPFIIASDQGIEMVKRDP
jgi:hypothetical protein